MARLLALVLALVLVAGCGSAAPASPGGSVIAPGPDGIALALAKVPRLGTTADDGAKAGTAVNAFGLELYRALVASDPGANLVFSPASIELALAMARAGAKGRTAAEMDAVMHGLGSDANATWVAALDKALNARTATFKDGAGIDREVILRSVNAPFAQQGYPLLPAYLDALAARFGAGLSLVDYAGDPEGSRRAINGWVDDQTEQRIPELLAEGIITPDTVLTLVNAIYLKAAWQTAFNAGATAPAPFTRLDGTTVDVPMMHASPTVPYGTGDGWQAIELPYIGGKLSMLVIVPDDLATFEARLDPATLGAVTGSLAPTGVTLALPKFGTETQVRLEDALGALGMPTAFSSAADFSGITTVEPLRISAVVHQANIDVDEAGTEAAAATAVVVERVSAVAGTVRLTVDRPFLFALRDIETGAILFLGRITEPAVRG
jgi:serpin B